MYNQSQKIIIGIYSHNSFQFSMLKMILVLTVVKLYNMYYTSFE